MRRLFRFFLLPVPEKLLVLRALVLVVFYRLALWCVPFRRLAVAKVSTVHQGHIWPNEKYVWAVQAAARCVPRATCLTQALVLRRVLASAGIASTIRIGVARDRDHKFEAHAWVEVDGRILIGGKEADRYTPIYAVSGR